MQTSRFSNASIVFPWRMCLCLGLLAVVRVDGLQVRSRQELSRRVTEGCSKAGLTRLKSPSKSATVIRSEERVNRRSTSAFALARRAALTPSAPTRTARTRPAARMIQGRTTAAPETDSSGTATSNRCPASVNVLRAAAAPPRSPAEVPPTASCTGAVSVAAARNEGSDTNNTTNAGMPTPPMGLGANLMRKSPFSPSRRVARGVARTSSSALARVTAAAMPDSPPRSIPGVSMGGMPETRVAGRRGVHSRGLERDTPGARRWLNF